MVESEIEREDLSIGMPTQTCGKRMITHLVNNVDNMAQVIFKLDTS